MTLTIRLAILAAIGAFLAALAWHFLWPAPAQSQVAGLASEVKAAPLAAAGIYTLKSKAGSYSLHLNDDGTARLEFTDRKGKHFGYQGAVADGKIVWKQTLHGKKWVDVSKPVDDTLTVESPTAVVTREGRFQRVKK